MLEFSADVYVQLAPGLACGIGVLVAGHDQGIALDAANDADGSGSLRPMNVPAMVDGEVGHEPRHLVRADHIREEARTLPRENQLVTRRWYRLGGLWSRRILNWGCRRRRCF